ncbi:hypothetical protein C8J56DRAFT_362867 [Mycena floridula]|nr:hypothetical protein C8J56DRAFT_362867 [Mycena floridula]
MALEPCVIMLFPFSFILKSSVSPGYRAGATLCTAKPHSTTLSPAPLFLKLITLSINPVEPGRIAFPPLYRTVSSTVMRVDHRDGILDDGVSLLILVAENTLVLPLHLCLASTLVSYRHIRSSCPVSS